MEHMNYPSYYDAESDRVKIENTSNDSNTNRMLRKCNVDPCIRIQEVIANKLHTVNSYSKKHDLPKVEYREGVARMISQSFNCVYTNKSFWLMNYENISIDHLNPISKSLDNTINNLYFSDGFFNLGKNDFDLPVAIIQSLEHVFTREQLVEQIQLCYKRIEKSDELYIIEYENIKNLSRKAVNQYMRNKLDLTIKAKMKST